MNMENAIFPHVKRAISDFLNDEEGNIPRNKVLTIGPMLIILGILFADDAFAKHSSHRSHSSHSSHSSGSSGAHSSHVSHESHTSHTSSTGTHSNSHSSHSSASVHDNSIYYEPDPTPTPTPAPTPTATPIPVRTPGVKPSSVVTPPRASSGSVGTRIPSGHSSSITIQQPQSTPDVSAIEGAATIPVPRIPPANNLPALPDISD